MGLFKHLYFDLSFLNPFKKKQDKQPKQEQSKNSLPVAQEAGELPAVSKKLLDKDLTKDGEELTLTLPKVKRPVPKPPKMAGKPAVENKPAEPAKAVQTNMQEVPDEDSFFTSLFEHIDKEQSVMHSSVPKKVLQHNLFAEMQSFWDDKKDQLNNAMMSKAIKQDFANKIQELHQMELEWQRLQLQQEKLQDELASKEILIENQIRSLKKSFKKLHLHANTHDHHQFVLSNGVTLSSLRELQDKLRYMDETVFNQHVNEHKNDFASWVEDVMGLHDLGQKLRQIDSKSQMQQTIHEWMYTV